MADIKVTIDGDASDLIKELDKVERAADDVDGAARSAGGGLGALGERADVGETRIMGLRDSVDGLATIMEGPGEAGISAYLQGWADMASGVVNFIVPTLQNLGRQMLTTAATAVRTAVQHVAATGRMIAGWIAMGLQSTLAAAKVAAAWLISIGPIALVIAAVVGLVVLIVKNWNKIKDFIKRVSGRIKDLIDRAWEGIKRVVTNVVEGVRDVISRVWDRIKSITSTFVNAIKRLWEGIQNAATATKDWIVDKFGALVEFLRNVPGRIRDAMVTKIRDVWVSIRDGFILFRDWLKLRWNNLVDFIKGIPGRISTVLAGVADLISAPFKAAFNAIANFWNSTVGSLSFTIPSWIPFVGGNSFNVPDIPTLHQGGVFRAGTRGGEGLALLRDGERVLRPQQRGGSGVVVNVNGFVGSPSELAREIDKALTMRSRTTPLGFT